MDKNQNKKNDKKILISSIILGIILVIMAGISMYFFSMNRYEKDLVVGVLKKLIKVRG